MLFVDNVKFVPNNWHFGQRPIVCISFDSNDTQHYETAFIEAKRRGINCTKYLWTADNSVNHSLLNWGSIKKMHELGWDIQCHSHRHIALTNLTEQEVHEDFQQVDQAFLSAGLPIPKHHAYPTGANNALVRDITAQYRLTGRTASGVDVLNGYDTIDFTLNGAGSDCAYGDTAKLQLVKDNITKAMSESKIAIIYMHHITTDTSQVHYTYTPYYLELLDWILEQDIQVLTVSEMWDKVTQ